MSDELKIGKYEFYPYEDENEDKKEKSENLLEEFEKLLEKLEKRKKKISDEPAESKR